MKYRQLKMPESYWQLCQRNSLYVMTSQVFSFLFFGLLFVLLFLFYKKEDKKNILVACGILFLIPFTFGYLSFSHDNTIPLWLISILLLFVFRFYKGKYRYFTIPLIIYFFALPLTTRSVVIINNTGKPIHKSIFTSSLDFTYKTGERVILPIEGGELINNMQSTLYVETVEYGVGFFGSESNNIVIDELEPYSCTRSYYKIDYFFQDPPTTINISRKQGEPMPEKETKYWLHN